MLVLSIAPWSTDISSAAPMASHMSHPSPPAGAGWSNLDDLGNAPVGNLLPYGKFMVLPAQYTPREENECGRPSTWWNVLIHPSNICCSYIGQWNVEAETKPFQYRVWCMALGSPITMSSFQVQVPIHQMVVPCSFYLKGVHGKVILASSSILAWPGWLLASAVVANFL